MPAHCPQLHRHHRNNSRPGHDQVSTMYPVYSVNDVSGCTCSGAIRCGIVTAPLGERWGMDNPLRGIALTFASTFIFSLSDATGKFLTGYLPITEIAWIRYVIFVVFALVLAMRSGPGRFHVRKP